MQGDSHLTLFCFSNMLHQINILTPIDLYAMLALTLHHSTQLTSDTRTVPNLVS